jgi:centromere protein I
MVLSPLQAALLRWLVMVYNVLEDYTALLQLYGVLFNLLDMFNLRYVCATSQSRMQAKGIDDVRWLTQRFRSHLAHLLALLTRRIHVKPFRIQKL